MTPSCMLLIGKSSQLCGIFFFTLYFLGGFVNTKEEQYSESNQILEYNILEDSYREIGHMLDTRYYHAVSVVQYSNFSLRCLDPETREANIT